MAAEKIFATTLGLRNDYVTGNVPKYETLYKFTSPVNGVVDGTVYHTVSDLETETMANAAIQAAIVDHANLQIDEPNYFAITDVRGGRI